MHTSAFGIITTFLFKPVRLFIVSPGYQRRHQRLHGQADAGDGGDGPVLPRQVPNGMPSLSPPMYSVTYCTVTQLLLCVSLPLAGRRARIGDFESLHNASFLTATTLSVFSNTRRDYPQEVITIIQKQEFQAQPSLLYEPIRLNTLYPHPHRRFISLTRPTRRTRARRP